MIFKSGLLIIFLFYVCSQQISAQCGCTNLNTKGDSLIFSGKVLDITTNNVASGLKITFGVDKIYRGNTDPVNVVSTPFPGKDCGFEFKRDSSYLVYAFKGRSIKTHTCTPTRIIRNSEEIPADLGEGISPHRDEDKTQTGILRLSLAALGGFILLFSAIFLRKMLKRNT